MTKETYLVRIYSSILSNRMAFLIACILTAALLVDTSLARISNFLTSNAQGSILLGTFTIIVIAYIVGQYIIVENTTKKIKGINSRNMVSKVNKILGVSQYGISVLLIVIIFEIYVNSNYHTLGLTVICEMACAGYSARTQFRFCL
jgi:uncharacterized membrane protein